jgi:hypothetical protein
MSETCSYPLGYRISWRCDRLTRRVVRMEKAAELVATFHSRRQRRDLTITSDARDRGEGRRTRRRDE